MKKIMDNLLLTRYLSLLPILNHTENHRMKVAEQEAWEDCMCYCALSAA